MRYFGGYFNDNCLSEIEDETEKDWAESYFKIRNPRNNKG
jgi:hypothetical protein